MDMTAPFYSKENWVQSLRKCLVTAHKGKPRIRVKSRSVSPQNPSPFHTSANPVSWGLSSLHEAASPPLPINPPKTLRTQVLFHSPQMLSLHLGSSAEQRVNLSLKRLHQQHTLPGISLATRCWVSLRRLAQGHHMPGSPRTLPSQQFPPVEVLQNPAPFQLWKGFYCN